MALKTFPNGLRVSIIPKTDAKLASVCLHVTSGTQSEKNYESGISEFTSRMLLMGTKKHPTNRELITFAKSNGILLETDNTAESIVIVASTTADNVGKAIDLVSEIAFESIFSTPAGDMVRNTLLSDIAKLQENPSYVLNRMVNQALFYRTGLANPKFGTTTTISRMTAGDSKEFFERVLTPKNTVISVVGDIDGDAVYEKVMKTVYTRFTEGGEYKKLKYVAEIDNFIGGERSKNKKLNQSRILFAFPSVSYKSSSKYVMPIILPLLERRIKDELKNASFFHSEKIFNEQFANNGKIEIECIVDFENVGVYMDEIVKCIKNMTAIGIGENEFEIEKNAFIIDFLKNNERSRDLCINAARDVAIAKQSYSLASELMKVELTTYSDANDIFRDVFDFSKLYIAYLGNPTDVNSAKYIDF